jgi:hypothetical protein
MQSDPVTVTEVETIDFDWVQPESQLMRRAKAHFDRLGIAYYEKQRLLSRQGALRALERECVAARFASLLTSRFWFLHEILQAEGLGRGRRGK